jgi:hypothetical protein
VQVCQCLYKIILLIKLSKLRKFLCFLLFSIYTDKSRQRAARGHLKAPDGPKGSRFKVETLYQGGSELPDDSGAEGDVLSHLSRNLLLFDVSSPRFLRTTQ